MTKQDVTESTAMAQVATTDQAEHMLPADPMVSMIERIAMDPNSDLAKLEKMLDMKERHEAAEAKAAFASAFAKASAEFPSIPLNGVGHNNKPYATLKDITSLTRPVLSENGLAMTFAIDTTGNAIIVTAKLMHKAGHVESTSINLPADNSGSKNAVQAVGSSQTYGQRYTAQAILGLSLGEDTEDDGRGSGKPESNAAPRDPWTHAIISEMASDATPRDKALAVADALCRQFQRMKGEKQLMNEWDRRSHLIEGERGFEEKHPDLYETVLDAYGARLGAIKEAA